MIKCDPVILDNRKLHCLMYADDLVLLSQSALGLHNSLGKLKEYCLKWKLTVNIGKTKIMIFNKCGRTLSAQYRFHLVIIMLRFVINIVI